MGKNEGVGVGWGDWEGGGCVVLARFFAGRWGRGDRVTLLNVERRTPNIECWNLDLPVFVRVWMEHSRDQPTLKLRLGRLAMLLFCGAE